MVRGGHEHDRSRPASLRASLFPVGSGRLALVAGGILAIGVLSSADPDSTSAAAAGPYLQGPPPAHTGGFDEPSCRECHFGAPPNAPAGFLELSGVPDRYRPDSTYTLTIEVAHPELSLGGFQIAARFAEGERAGEQAGEWTCIGDRVQVTRGDGPIDYLHHTESGARPADEADAASVRWTITWRAPERGSAPVVFHVAANAANGDYSEFGDFIYLARATAGP